MTRTQEHRLLMQAGSLLLLLFAIAPSVTFVGHGPLDVVYGHSHDLVKNDVPFDESDGDHAAHCHDGMSKCAGPQSLIGTWWAVEDGTGLAFGDPLLANPVAGDRRHVQEFYTKILQPPKVAA